MDDDGRPASRARTRRGTRGRRACSSSAPCCIGSPPARARRVLAPRRPAPGRRSRRCGAAPSWPRWPRPRRRPLRDRGGGRGGPRRAPSPPRPPPPPWPLFRGDAARAGARGAARGRRRPCAPLWQTPRRRGRRVARCSPADLVVVATADGRLVFLDRAHGRARPRDEARLGHRVLARAGRTASLHVGTDDGELVAVDVADGRERYRVKLGELVRSSPLPLGDRVFVGVVEDKGDGRAGRARRRNGQAGLDAQARARSSRRPRSPASLVLVGSDDGALHAIDARQGRARLVARRSAAGCARRRPCSATSRWWATSTGAWSPRSRTADGTVVWTRELGHAVYSSACLRPRPVRGGLPRRPRPRPRPGHGRAASSTSATRGPVVVVARGRGRPLPGRLHRRRALPARRDGPRARPRRRWRPSGIQSSPALDATGVVVGSGRRPARPRGSRHEGAAPARLARTGRARALPGGRQPPVPAARQRARPAALRRRLRAPRRRACSGSGARRDGRWSLRRLLGPRPSPTPAREKAFRKALGLKPGRCPPIPRGRWSLLDALADHATACPPGSVAVVLDYAHALAPAGRRRRRRARRTSRTLARWASEPKVAARRPLIVLIAPRGRRGLGRGLRGRVGGRGRGGAAAGPRARAPTSRATCSERVPRGDLGADAGRSSRRRPAASRSSRSRTSCSARGARGAARPASRSSSARSTCCGRSTATCSRS